MITWLKRLRQLEKTFQAFLFRLLQFRDDKIGNRFYTGLQLAGPALTNSTCDHRVKQQIA